MPGLLDLPSELLYDIIDLVASSPNTTLPDGTRYRPDWKYGRAIVCFPTTHHLSLNPTRHLLFVCRRLYAETSICNTKMPKTWKMDVAIINNHWIWPCFRYIPGGNIGYVLEKLEINLIYCCTEDERGSYSMTTPARAYEDDFVKMISQLLHSRRSSSPFGSMRLPWSRSDFRVKSLAINLASTSIRPPNEMLSDVEIPCRHIEGLKHLTFDPLYSADLFSSLRHVDWLVDRMNHSIYHASGGFIIRERVDRILFRVDGLAREEIDIAKDHSEREARRIAQYKQSEAMGSST